MNRSEGLGSAGDRPNISHYRVVEKPGRGGLGVVYKAEDVKLHRFVALRLLPGEISKEPNPAPN
jgi:serine/threonine protein kinase